MTSTPITQGLYRVRGQIGRIKIDLPVAATNSAQAIINIINLIGA